MHGGAGLVHDPEAELTSEAGSRGETPFWRYFQCCIGGWRQDSRAVRDGWVSVKVSGLPQSLEEVSNYQTAEKGFSKVSRKREITYFNVRANMLTSVSVLLLTLVLSRFDHIPK